MRFKVLVFFMVLITCFITGMVNSSTIDNDNLTKITNPNSFRVYLENQTKWYDELYSEYSKTTNRILYSEPASDISPAQMAVPESISTGGSAKEHSTTNVQVVGVDEADYLKNDGKYIYQIHDKSLVITDVFPTNTGKIVSITPVNGSPSSLFLHGDNLVVFSSEYGKSLISKYKNETLVSDRNDITHVYVYDIKNPAQPNIVRDIVLPGRYENGRMIGDTVYAVTQDNPSYKDPGMPVISEGENIIRPNIWGPNIPIRSYLLYTLASIDLTEDHPIEAESFLMGWDNTLYVSLDNAYMAYKKWTPYWFNSKRESSGIDKGDESVVHRFSIKNGTISYEATGKFTGSLLNQFSLDESDGNLRIATTNNRYQDNKSISDNNVYVLSPNLTVIGKLENLAKGERIYSTRFMGNLLYLVTFKQTDPLFVIDLSNPNQPGVLGELKIPGYSDYLHPYDSTHLIGIGKDTEENEWGGVIPTGLKVAFFNVSDLNNPKLVDSRIIGEKGSGSEVLSDHKAFLLDMNRSVMALPMKEVLKIAVPDSNFKESYTTAAWQGTYLFGIDPDTGFIDIGKIEQVPVIPNSYYGSGSSVKRSVIMDNVLYTVSDNRIIGSDFNNTKNRLLMIDIPDNK